MCLSTVYKIKKNNEKELFCKNIASVQAEGNTLTFINLMGNKTVIDGSISKIDLMENCIYVKAITH